MTLSILNDVHIGCSRAAGTTLQTAWQLRQDLLTQFGDVLQQVDGDLMILGDLFDGADIPKPDMFRTYQLLGAWLDGQPGSQLWMVDGNHDIARSSLQMSAFQLLCAFLKEGYSDRVHHVSGGCMTPYGYVLSHVPNQDILNIELEKIPECDYAFFHANYDNKFAAEADHSLNISKEQVQKLPVKYAVFAHEHQQRTMLNGKVVIIGNQFVASVSDALGNDTKRRMVINVDGSHDFIETWQADGDFSTQDWRSLTDTGRFIRVTGDATAAEADDVARTLAKFRTTAKALVVTNAVRIEGVNDQAELVMTAEEVTAFDVREALREYLDDEENKKVDALLAPAAAMKEAA